MATAEEVATVLAYEFLRHGNFSAATGPVEVPQLAQAVVAAAADGEHIVEEYVHNAEPFANLAVQSVGFEVGPDQPKVHIYLTRGNSKLINTLPQEIGGVPIRVHKMGSLVVRPEAAASANHRGNLFERHNRICCGSSCAPTSENLSGTLGALARIGGGRQLYLLSNNHVLAGCNHVAKDQPIVSPSNNDSHPMVRAPLEIGRHFRIEELRSGTPDFVIPGAADLALARATDNAIISSWQGDDVDGYDTPVQWASPRTGVEVMKFGRTTGFTRGVIEAKTTAPLGLDYNSKHFKAKVWFSNVWSIRAQPDPVFALPGDSGSLIVDDGARHAIGLVFACNKSGDTACFIPMQNIMDAFTGLTLVGRHGVAA
jgi:hypothetical protein